MPITKSAKKKLRQDKKKRKVNLLALDKIKLEIKNYKKKPTQEKVKNIMSLLDIALKKRIFHANKVARLKSKFSQLAVTTTKRKKESLKK